MGGKTPIAHYDGYDYDTDPIAVHRVSICELLDRVLNKGAVLTGEVVISVANVELLYIAVSLLVSSVDTLLEAINEGGVKD